MTTFVAILLALQNSLPSACLDAIAHPRGFTWTYSGTRLATNTAGAPLRERVTWTTTLLDKRTVGNMSLALVRGFVMDLASGDLVAGPRLSILACSDGRLVRYEGQADEDVRTAFKNWDSSLLARSTLLLETPLRDGDLLGQTPRRSDRLYGWDVESIARDPGTPQSCPAGTGTTYRLTYRTNPDVSTVEWQAGVGIRGYYYQHHGTPAGVDVRLVSCGLISA